MFGKARAAAKGVSGIVKLVETISKFTKYAVACADVLDYAVDRFQQIETPEKPEVNNENADTSSQN